MFAAALSIVACGARAESEDASACGPTAVAEARNPRFVVPLKPRPWAPTAATYGAAGLWVSRDPVDGTLGMPSPQDRAGLSGPGISSISPETPVAIDRLADGTLIAKLDDRWANYAVARLGPDGRPLWTCVPGREGVAQFLARPGIVTAPTVKREER